MSENIANTTKTGPKTGNRKKLVAIIATAAVLITGGVVTGVTVSNYNAETAALCVAATDARAEALTAADEASVAATAAVKVTEAPFELKDLAGGAGTTTLYIDRPAVEAVPEVKKTETALAVPAVEARQSGADFIKDVTDAQESLAAVVIPEDCTDRDQAAAITKAIDDSAAAVVTLDAAVEALNADVELFKADEATRILAEREAARLAAEAEAARLAAEEAARQAEQNAYDGGNDDGDGGSGGGGNSGGGGGGGLIVPPHGGGGCPPGTTFIGEGCA